MILLLEEFFRLELQNAEYNFFLIFCLYLNLVTRQQSWKGQEVPLLGRNCNLESFCRFVLKEEKGSVGIFERRISHWKPKWRCGISLNWILVEFTHFYCSNWFG